MQQVQVIAFALLFILSFIVLHSSRCDPTLLLLLLLPASQGVVLLHCTFGITKTSDARHFHIFEFQTDSQRAPCTRGTTFAALSIARIRLGHAAIVTYRSAICSPSLALCLIFFCANFLLCASSVLSGWRGFGRFVRGGILPHAGSVMKVRKNKLCVIVSCGIGSKTWPGAGTPCSWHQ